MRKFRKIVLALVGLITIIVSTVVAVYWPLDYYLPHERAVIILPFDAKYDPQCSLIPMGETIYHPDPPCPGGHPGIDFGIRNSNMSAPFIASMSGTISKITFSDNDDANQGEGYTSLSPRVVDVVITNGPYQTVYVSLNAATLPANITVGARIKQGDVVGLGNFKRELLNGTIGEMIHWEFGSTSKIVDRLSPLTYFTEESRIRIEKIWEKADTPEKIDMKTQFPKICNGIYDGKEEK